MTENYYEDSTFYNTSFYDYNDINSTEFWQSDDYSEYLFSFHVIVILTVVYVFLFILGIIGNFLTCIVIASNKSMHTATNFYLISLACSDLLILLTNVPFTLHKCWYTYTTANIYLLYALFSEIASYSSILTVTVLTVERYLAICHPFNKHSMSKLDVVTKYIIVIWIVSCLLGAILGFLPEIYDEIKMEISMGISVILFFVIPIVMMSVLYFAICFKLKKRNKDFVTQKSAKDEGKIIKMLVAIVIVFILCWTPFHVDRILVAFKLIGYGDSVLAFLVASVLYSLSATLNPILYSLMSEKFRQGFKEIISNVKNKRKSNSTTFEDFLSNT